MLKNLPPALNGDLLKILRDMGHGDELTIADANYPAASNSKRLARLDGMSMTEVLADILQVLPLDEFVDSPAFLMSPGDGEAAPLLEPVQSIVDSAHGRRCVVTSLPRFDFYDRARQSFACIATSDRRLYANIIVKKGIIRPGA